MNESQKFINLETISAKLLFAATILALCVSNSPLNIYYNNFFNHLVMSKIGNIHVEFNLLDVINEGLMAIFFLVVGLEIKYEIMAGTLNSVRKAALPGIGALGGMMVPALIYLSINHYDKTFLRGWAVPTATDIAFAVSIISFLGRRVPTTLKVFLTALAILDDLAAIIIIAFFYTMHLSFIFLGLAGLCGISLFILNRANVTHLVFYVVIGISLWGCLLKSGVHSTLAGVIVALMIPMQHRNKPSVSPLRELQHKLHPWVALLILPLFAFANAGISFLNLTVINLHIPIVMGVFLGLFLGKQIGVFGAAWLGVKLNIASLPDRVHWRDLYAVAIICGIGFTISLFIGSLAFGYNDPSYLNSIKIGVLSGSLLSGIVGYILLLLMHMPRHIYK